MIRGNIFLWWYKRSKKNQKSKKQTEIWLAPKQRESYEHINLNFLVSKCDPYNDKIDLQDVSRPSHFQIFLRLWQGLQLFWTPDGGTRGL